MEKHEDGSVTFHASEIGAVYAAQEFLVLAGLRAEGSLTELHELHTKVVTDMSIGEWYGVKPPVFDQNPEYTHTVPKEEIGTLAMALTTVQFKATGMRPWERWGRNLFGHHGEHRAVKRAIKRIEPVSLMFDNARAQGFIGNAEDSVANTPSEV